MIGDITMREYISLIIIDTKKAIDNYSKFIGIKLSLANY